MRSRKVSSRMMQQPYDLVLVEGSYGPQHLLESVPISLVVYIETPLLQRLVRRLRRDVRDRQRPALYVIRQMLRRDAPGRATLYSPPQEPFRRHCSRLQVGSGACPQQNWLAGVDRGSTK